MRIARVWFLVVSLSLLTFSGYYRVALAQRTTLTHTSVNVTTGTTIVLAANTSRNFLLLTNQSDTDIYCKFGVAAVALQGFVLRSAGGALLLDYKFSAQALNCIHSGIGNKVLGVSEGVQ